MQDHYFKYVCTDGKTVFFALHKSDLEAERNNDINLYFEKCKKNDPDIKKSDLEQKYQIITSYPAKCQNQNFNRIWTYSAFRIMEQLLMRIFRI